MKTFKEFLNESANRADEIKIVNNLSRFISRMCQVRDVSFFVDASGSMYEYLPAVKEAIKRGIGDSDRQFKFYSFSDSVKQVETVNDIDIDGPSLEPAQLVDYISELNDESEFFYIIADYEGEYSEELDSLTSKIKTPNAIINLRDLMKH